LSSIRIKLVLVISLVTVSSFVTVVISNLQIIRADKEKTLSNSNFQVSELVTRSVETQMTEYRRGLQYLTKTFVSNPNLAVDPNYFPDYVWVAILDWSGQVVYEWNQKKKLEEANLEVSKLLGKKNQDSLFQEVKQVLSLNDGWLLFNSTVDPLFPTFLFASAIKPSDAEHPTHVILAEIDAAPLFKQIHPRRGQDLILIDSHQNVIFSTQDGWNPAEIAFKDEKALEVMKGLDRGRQKQVTISYGNRESQLSWFQKFKEGEGITLVLQEPVSALSEGAERIQFQSLIVGLIILVISINLIILIAGRLTKPLKDLTTMMQKVGKGEFTGRIKVKSKDEIGKLATFFNKMLQELDDREKEIDRAKSKLIQSEKMSAFGQMSAGIAHEVKNPLAGILGYAQIVKKKLDDRPELVSHIEIIEKETIRCKEIVENLMRFARQEKAQFLRVDANRAVRDSVRLVEHQISVSGIKIIQNYALEGAPIFIKGNTNQLQQVMLNLMLNAQHAMESKGTLTVSTHYDEKSSRVMVVVSDTGAGMTPEVQARIFEPFYTTKGVGKGTGLGLSVSIGIVKDHRGSIEVESSPGKGSTFTISIPLDDDPLGKAQGAAAAQSGAA